METRGHSKRKFRMISKLDFLTEFVVKRNGFTAQELANRAIMKMAYHLYVYGIEILREKFGNQLEGKTSLIAASLPPARQDTISMRLNRYWHQRLLDRTEEGKSFRYKLTDKGNKRIEKLKKRNYPHLYGSST